MSRLLVGDQELLCASGPFHGPPQSSTLKITFKTTAVLRLNVGPYKTLRCSIFCTVRNLSITPSVWFIRGPDLEEVPRRVEVKDPRVRRSAAGAVSRTLRDRSVKVPDVAALGDGIVRSDHRRVSTSQWLQRLKSSTRLRVRAVAGGGRGPGRTSLLHRSRRQGQEEDELVL